MPKSSNRPRRGADLIQREIAFLIQREIKDPRLGMVTVSAVKVTPDLSYAKVYYTVLGNDEQVAKTEIGLKNATGFMRSMLAKKIKLRTVPELQFIHDVSLEQGNRLSALIKQARDSDKTTDEHDDD